MSVPGPRVAIAHDYLTQRGGAERVVLAMARAFPDAPIYTTLYEPTSTFDEFAGLDIRTSPGNHIGWIRRHHRAALPFMPFMSRSINIDADIVLTSSSGWAHGFRRNGQSLVYCYSPARWLYQTKEYLGPDASPVVKLMLRAMGPWLKHWDRRAAARSSRYLAISTVVQDRIMRTYGLEAAVLAAPQTVQNEITFENIPALEEFVGDDDYYLCVSRLLPYKNVDTVVDAISSTPDRKLVVIGRGPRLEALQASAGSNVLFLQGLSDAQMRTAYAGCTGVIAASYEDFGLTPLEGAMFGKPSIVLRWGGYLDTMIEGRTAVFFDEPDPQLISDAITTHRATAWDPELIREHSRTFSEERFADSLRTEVDAMWGTTENHREKVTS